MKLLLLHDHKFRKIGNDYYSTGCFSDDVLSWYQRLFENVEIVGRIIEEKIVSPRYSKIVNKNVKISDKRQLKQKIQEADFIIARLPSINGYRGLHFARKYKKKYRHRRDRSLSRNSLTVHSPDHDDPCSGSKISGADEPVLLYSTDAESGGNGFRKCNHLQHV